MTNFNKTKITKFGVKDAKKVKGIEKALKRAHSEYFACFDVQAQEFVFVIVYDEYGQNMTLYAELMKEGINIMPQTGTTGAPA